MEYHIHEDQMEAEVRRRKEEHMRRVATTTPHGTAYKIGEKKRPYIPCAHDSCTQCHGTGVKIDGTACIHMISCSRPKCSSHSL